MSCDESGEAVIVVRDPGSGFDPGAIADPLDSATILKPSGRGLFLIDELMEHVQFADGGRGVQMRKKKHRTSPRIKVNVGCHGRSLCALDDCEVDAIVNSLA